MKDSQVIKFDACFKRNEFVTRLCLPIKFCSINERLERKSRNDIELFIIFLLSLDDYSMSMKEEKEKICRLKLTKRFSVSLVCNRSTNTCRIDNRTYRFSPLESTTQELFNENEVTKLKEKTRNI